MKPTDQGLQFFIHLQPFSPSSVKWGEGDRQNTEEVGGVHRTHESTPKYQLLQVW